MMANYKTTGKMERHIFVALFSSVLLLVGSNARAAVVEVLQKDWGKGGNAECCDANFKINFDEIKVDEKGGEKIDHSFADGVVQNFTLTHSGGSGDLVFTIGGSTPIIIDLPELTGWQTIGLQAKVGGDKNNTLSIFDLNLVSANTGSYDFANALNVPDGKDKTQAIILTDNGTPDYFSNFTLTGKLVFDWDKNPKKGDLEFKIGVAGQTAVPVPPAIWLFGSALTGLGWLRRKQTI